MLVNVDYYYCRGFEGGEDAAELEKALAKAERIINVVTSGKCDKSAKLDEFKKNQLKQAICAEAENLLVSNSNNFSVKIGDYSYSGNSSSDKINGVVSVLAGSILKASGLMNPAASVL